MDDLATLPPTNSSKTQEENAILNHFFPQSADAEKKSGWFDNVDFKFIGIATGLFLLLGNSWTSSLLSAIPHLDSDLINFGARGVIFFLFLVIYSMFE